MAYLNKRGHFNFVHIIQHVENTEIVLLLYFNLNHCNQRADGKEMI